MNQESHLVEKSFSLKAEKIFTAILAASLFALFSSAIAKDDDSAAPWEDFRDVIERANSPALKEEIENYQDSWAAYVKDELIDGSIWQFRDNTHKATVALNPTNRWSNLPFHRFSGCYDVRKVQMHKAGAHPADVELSRIIDRKLATKTSTSLLMSASSPTSNRVHFVCKKTLTGEKLWDDVIKLTPDRTYYEKIHTLPKADRGDYTVAFELGDKPGQVNLYYLSLRDISDGHERPAVVRKFIESVITETEKQSSLNELTPKTLEETPARILKYRTAMLTILVRDKSGKPVPGASVAVEQRRHYFLFGCNLDGLKPDEHTEFQRNYQKRFSELFNYAKIPCYWSEIESAPGKRDYAKISAMAKWCDAHAIRTNGYGLVSLFHIPAWAPKNFRVGVGQLRATVIDCIKHLSAQITSWDVVDELGLAANIAKPNVLTQWLGQDGEAKVTEQALFWATYALEERKQPLIINSIAGSFLTDMAYHGALPDAIGCPVGMQGQLMPLQALWLGLKRPELLHRDIFMTDLAILSGPPRPGALKSLQTASDWRSTIHGEQLQAEYIAKLYSLMFSNPRIVSISWRDLSDQGAWLGAPGGLLRRDGTPKPAYNVLVNLIHKQWWTTCPPKPVDSKGTIATPAFFGDYNITVNDGKGHIIKKQISFTPGSRLQAQIITVGN